MCASASWRATKRTICWEPPRAWPTSGAFTPMCSRATVTACSWVGGETEIILTRKGITESLLLDAQGVYDTYGFTPGAGT